MQNFVEKLLKENHKRKMKNHMKLNLRELCYKFRSWAAQFYFIKVMGFSINIEVVGASSLEQPLSCH
jgi:hypothetical protein